MWCDKDNVKGSNNTNYSNARELHNAKIQVQTVQIIQITAMPENTTYAR